MTTEGPDLPLGRLERAQVREAWPGEASDFTPWLSRGENLELLGQTIGLDLDPENVTEQAVGDFRADIVARDGDAVVLIENQFGRTDHDHLGKLLVYGSGVEASVVIWVSEKLRDEHRRALDWLNDNTREGLDFFGLELELWRIGDSPAAPKFNVVSQPNGWAKAVRAAASETALEVEQLAFWQGFAEAVAEADAPLRLGPPRARYWQRVGLGRSGFQISLVRYRQRGEIGCELRITHPEATRAFDELHARRSEVEATLGPLEWLRLPDRRVSRVLARRSVDLEGREHWPEIFVWLRERATAFGSTFTPLIGALDLTSDAEGVEEDDAA